MNLLRRKFLRTASFVGAAVTVGSAVLVPQRAVAAYNEAAFKAKDVDGAISASLGSSSHSPSDAIKLKAEGFATPLLALRIEIEVVRGEELLEDRLMELVRDIPRSAAAPVRR